MHSRQANDAVASERSIFSKNHGRGLDARGGRKLRTDTHTRGTTTVTIIIKIIRSAEAQ